MKINVYDIDGIFVPDLTDIPSSINLNTFIPELRRFQSYQQSLFFPKDPFGVITGRLKNDKLFTNQFFVRNELYPEFILHENTDPTNPAKYKAECLLSLIDEHDIDVYYESNPNEADEIVKLVKGKVKVEVFSHG